ncbi:hypothetical protein GH714_020991 [Hevea brasiliensis]|uniref:BRO1 domain-containing protein n=1 Tax=Hevea brasiliensis TaxID=3981 RepID=A0A6A6KQF8_HEVBR|nr:hypothetical protein GH714_020991 [Hevea brasiliensis]
MGCDVLHVSNAMLCHVIVFEDLIAVRDSVSLEHLKELSSRRRVIEHSINQTSLIIEAIAREMSGGSTSRSEQECLRLEHYLPLLENFIYHADIVNNSSQMIREAAGVFHYLAHEVLPSLHSAISAEKPPEATSSVTSAISLICLAEAQAVYIRKADEKGNTGFGVLEKLHHGVADLLSEAVGTLNSGIGDSKGISSRFLEFITSCKALHELRSQTYFAEGLKNDGQIGIAIGVLLIVESEPYLPSSYSHPSAFPQSITVHSASVPAHKGYQETGLALIFRLDKVVSAVISEGSAVGSTSASTDVFRLTYLEGNSWLWEVGGVNILVDPILVGNLDFGIPWLYDAAKKVLKNFQLRDLPEVDCLLITQSLDDHCHLKTLKPLSEMLPNLRVIATPNAKPLLDPLFSNVTYLEPGQSSEIEASDDSKVRVQATAGPVLGPPWQRPENGYLVNSPQSQMTLYYEPHCAYNKSFLEKEHADIVITPVIKQLLPNFTLVYGQEDAVKLAKLLHAKFIVPMKNGDLDSKGFLASIIHAEGTVESFKELLAKELPDAQVLEPTPGVTLEVSAT